MTYTLPSDILISEILHKLPVKTIARFKCVSKSLHARISSHKFVSLHLRNFHPTDVNRNVLIIDDSQGIVLYTLDLESPILSAKKLPLCIDKVMDVSFVGCCNGLFCIILNGSVYFNFILFNPTTTIYKHIIPLHEPIVGNHGYEPTYYGFGFDSVNNDYKLVKVSFYSINRKSEEYNRVMVYSLRKNSWVTAPNETLVSFTETTSEASVVDNHLLHWMQSNQRIACFDVCSEQWKDDILCPPGVTPSSLVHIGVFNKCVCLFVDRTVWILKSYGMKNSWVKLYNISGQFELRPLCHSKRSEDGTLFWYQEDGNIYLRWLDLVKNKVVKEAKIEGISSNLGICHLYDRTIVPIPQQNKVYINNKDRIRNTRLGGTKKED